MRDSHIYRDHRMESARATGCKRAAERGYDFGPDEPSYDLASTAIVSGICVLIAVGIALACAVTA